MKRLFALILMLSVLLSLCACGAAAQPAEPTPELSPEATPEPAYDPAAGIPEGMNRVVFYWNCPDGYENCDMWIWLEGKDGHGYLFEECEYGVRLSIDVPEGTEKVGFIVRRDCSDPGGAAWGSAVKDYESDRFAAVEGRLTEVYLKSGDPAQYISKDGGKTLDMAREIKLAAISGENTIEYSVSPAAEISDLNELHVYADGKELKIVSLSSLGKSSAKGVIELEQALDLACAYKLSIEGYGEKAVTPLKLFDSDYFAENYHYDGKLGAEIKGGKTLFTLWAPTASRVVLNLFESGHEGEAYEKIDMSRGEKGVWQAEADCGHGTYYTYTVTTAEGSREAVDPYAKAAGLNGNRGMVVDLSLTDPEGWDNAELKNPIGNYSEAVIWEVHVRDFSNKIEASQYKGKYLAFTETGLTNEHGQPVGIDYLKNLGITHVHLLPIYDYATVDESGAGAQFNWGYDPKNYNVPEGSYSTDPYNGEVRIKELKQLVMALHEAGIGVIMDVVYNHTYNTDNCFGRTVPYYYYRYDSLGANTSASGCGNDTASERYMYSKFMVESAAYWVEEYKLDGLRYDLMGLHDLETMQEVEKAVHAINPNAIIYGEGWTMGATLDGSKQADQRNISGIEAHGIGAIAVFNDVIRDGLKGSVFEPKGKGYINGSANAATEADLIFSLKGGEGVGQGWAVKNAMVINYMSAHDNNTLWDKLLMTNPDQSDAERARMNRLGAAVLMLSKGTPFWQAGEEMLRTKDGDENSYKSSDAINNIDWSVLCEGSLQQQTMEYYKGLIAMRRGFDIFTGTDCGIESAEVLGSGIMQVSFTDGKGGRALAVINPHGTALPFSLEGEWNLVADAERSGTEVLSRESGQCTVEAVSVRVYLNDAALK